MYRVAHIHWFVVSCAVVTHFSKVCLFSSAGSEKQAGIYLLLVHASVDFVTHENQNSLEIGVIDTRFTRCPEYVSTVDRARSHIAIGWKITAYL